MAKELKIDRSIYLVDDETKTYKFLARNPDWKKLDLLENEANKPLNLTTNFIEISFSISS